MIGPNVPEWFRKDIIRMPYHQYIEFITFLERPDHVEQIDAVFADALPPPEPIERIKCSCNYSTGIFGYITRGRGKLDPNGYWQFPCTHGNDMVEHEDDFVPAVQKMDNPK